MPNEGQPGRPIRTLFRPIVTGENPADNIFVDWNVESQGYLLSNSWTAPRGIASFGLDNGFDEFTRPAESEARALSANVLHKSISVLTN